MPAKINWRLFFRESSVLILHTLLAAFYMRIAIVLFDYYRAQALACLFLFISLCFVLPLIVNFIDLWARTMAAVREEALAEKLLKLSISIQQRFFGLSNASLSVKQAMLASLYFDTGRLDEAGQTFEQAWNSFEKSRLKLPLLHQSFASYLKILDTAGDTETSTRVKKALQNSGNLLLAQRLAICLLTMPIVAFLLYNQFSEAFIAQANARGQVSLALERITQMAERESFVLGPYAAARVYKDYALAFEDCRNQPGEMAWCAVRSLAALQNSGQKDEYMKVMMFNLKGNACLLGGHFQDAARCFLSAVEISKNWTDDMLSSHGGDARVERDKAMIALAEIYRNQDKFEEAEPLYKAVLGLDKVQDGADLDLKQSDPVETIDRIHKLQHIELKLGKKEEALRLQKSICAILEKSVQALAKNNKNSSLCDFGVREASRELDVCSLMLQDAGLSGEAEKYRARSEDLRNLHQKALRLNSKEQDSVVDASLRITQELLSVKYRDADWKVSLDKLLNEDLKSTRARGSFEQLPWLDPNLQKISKGDAGQLKSLKAGSCKLEVEIAPLSIRNSREGDGIAVDVQGTVRIFKPESAKSDEQRFAFAYVLKEQNSGKPKLDYLLDNQTLGSFGLD